MQIKSRTTKATFKILNSTRADEIPISRASGNFLRKDYF